MRKIERQMLNAIAARRNWGSANTDVYCEANGDIEVRLHNNIIARYNSEAGKWSINLCGWNTTTTRSRLSAIVRYCSEYYVGVGTKRGQVELRGMRGVPDKSIEDNGWTVIR